MSRKTKKFLYYISIVGPVLDSVFGFIKGCYNIVSNPELIDAVKKQEEELKQLKQFIKDQKYHD